MEKIDLVRFANEKFSNRCENVVDVKVQSSYIKPVPMNLNACGLVEAIRQGIIVSAEKPTPKATELLLEQLLRIKFNNAEKAEMTQKITEIVGDEYAELVCRAIELE
ncbi:MAG: hypothetical protein E7019_05875 [Alphaproteobacteria bacterium]|nr:hypothetical protein [Alphaproteobacteria bacterium]